MIPGLEYNTRWVGPYTLARIGAGRPRPSNVRSTMLWNHQATPLPNSSSSFSSRFDLLIRIRMQAPLLLSYTTSPFAVSRSCPSDGLLTTCPYNRTSPILPIQVEALRHNQVYHVICQFRNVIPPIAPAAGRPPVPIKIFGCSIRSLCVDAGIALSCHCIGLLRGPAPVRLQWPFASPFKSGPSPSKSSALNRLHVRYMRQNLRLSERTMISGANGVSPLDEPAVRAPYTFPDLQRQPRLLTVSFQDQFPATVVNVEGPSRGVYRTAPPFQPLFIQPDRGMRSSWPGHRNIDMTFVMCGLPSASIQKQLQSHGALTTSPFMICNPFGSP